MLVAVAGGGIAGLTASLALAAHGFEVSVHEQAEALSEIGAGLQISPNGMAVLERLGVAPLLADIACRPCSLVMRDGSTGDTLATLRFGESMQRRYGAPYCTMLRSDLQAALLARVREQPRITLSMRSDVNKIRSTASGVVFTAGGQMRRADILVAADGIRSRTRVEAFRHAGPIPLGRVAWRGAVPAEALGDGAARVTIVVFMAAGAHLVHYPVAGGRSVNIVAVDDGRGDAPAAARFGSAARAVIEAVPTWIRTSLERHSVSPRWVCGRAVLIGDAAHAMAPSAAQGAVQAIEDSWVLARALRETDNPLLALANYDRSRRSRVASVARTSLRNMHLYELARWPATARNSVLRALPESVLLRRLDWLFGWRPG